MISRLQRPLVTAIRLMIAGGCCLGIWYSWRLARADYLFREDTESSVNQAISMAPDAWTYYMRLAEFEPAHAQRLLTTALQLDPYNAQANIELGLQFEAKGDLDSAERSLLRAFAVDHTYVTRWALANFYFRRGNMGEFWSWARSAAAMPSNDLGSLFALCWRVSPDPQQITAAIATDNPEFLRQYIGFLQSRNQNVAAAAIAARLIRNGNPSGDLSRLISLVNGLVDSHDAQTAISLWQMLIERHWVVADATEPNNPTFARQPLSVDFDWQFPGCSGMYSVLEPSGLDTEFSGFEPADCTVAEQTIAVTPGVHVFDYVFQTTGIPPGAGLRWQIENQDSDTILATSSDLSSDAVEDATLKFTVPQNAPLLRVRLVYQRAPGMPRVSGSLTTKSTRIRPGSS